MSRATNPSKRIFPENYVEDVSTAKSPDDISFYKPLLEDFYTINEEYCGRRGVPKDFAENSQDYIAVRYPDVFTRRQIPFSLLTEQDHPNPYPAAKIDISSTQFNVLAEGPSHLNLENLLWGLKQVEVNALVAVGRTYESGREKFYNYMVDSKSKELTSAEYFEAISPGFVDRIEMTRIQDTQFKFYQYTSEAHGDFFIMHIPNWDDHGLPRFNEADKTLLAYYFSFGPNSCFHCSAGMGRSVALLLSKMVFSVMQHDFQDMDDVRRIMEQEFRKIKAVKPGAGEQLQYAIVPGLVEDVRCLSEEIQLRSQQVEGDANSDGLIEKIDQLAITKNEIIAPAIENLKREIIDSPDKLSKLLNVLEALSDDDRSDDEKQRVLREYRPSSNDAAAAASIFHQSPEAAAIEVFVEAVEKTLNHDEADLQGNTSRLG